MMIAVGAAIKKKEWVVWLGWSPHWMNLAYEMKYLEDPLKLWGSEPEVVKTVARADLQKVHPNVYKFFTQFKVTPEIQSNWIEKFSHQKQKAEDVAKEWIRNNMNVVDKWVEGVTSVDGKKAGESIRKAFGL
jgi:glycine betaine/proline transport system substrate-binding protein